MHIGLLAIVYLFPKDMDEVLASKQKDYLELSKAITGYFGISHYQLGYMLLSKWQLPDVYQMVLRHFEDIELTWDESEQLRLLHASQQICGLLLDEKIEEPEEKLLQIAEHSLLPIDDLTNVFYELSGKKEDIQKLADAIRAI